MTANKTFLTVGSNLFKIGNDLIERELRVKDGVLFTSKLINKKTNTDLINGFSKEFEFKANDKNYTNTNFRYMGYETAEFFDSARLIIKLLSEDQLILIKIYYETYNNFAISRKWIEIVNNSENILIIRDLAWEKIKINRTTQMYVYKNYLTDKYKYATDVMNDCVFCVHDQEKKEGFLMVTEAAGVLKQMEAFKEEDYISIMFNNSYQTIFEKHVKPFEIFKTPESFLLLYKNENYKDVMDNEYKNFIENKIIKTDCKKIPNVTWFSWNEDIRFGINEKYIKESISEAKQIGIDCVLIDAGWYDYLGDFNVDSKKFPNGIEKLAQLIHKNEMKLGLWVSFAGVDIKSKVFKEHPEWLAKDKSGNLVTFIKNIVVMCLDSDYKYYISDKMKELIKRYDVDLLKIDFQTLRNIYFPKYQLGCSSSQHNHKSHNESFYNINEAMLEVMDNIRNSEKNCLLKLSIESYGINVGVDIAQYKVCHTTSLINSPTRPDFARRIAYQRSRVVPSYCLSLHATTFNDKDIDYSLLTNMTTGVLITGNFSKLEDKQKNRLKYWFNWLNEYRKKNDFYKYNKVSNIFEPPNTSDVPDWEKYVVNYNFDDNYYGIIAKDEWKDLHEVLWGEDGKLTEKDWHQWIENEKVACLDHIDMGSIEDPELRFVSSNWDGIAKLNDEGEGVIIIFRPENNNENYKTFKLPWLKDNREYKLKNINKDKDMGMYNSETLKSKGLKIDLNKREAILITIEKYCSEY